MADIFRDNVGGISTAPMNESIARTTNLLGIGVDRAFFLLLQYRWNEDQLRRDLSCLEKAAILLNRSIEPLLESQSRNGTCVRCLEYTWCERLSCHDLVCRQCIDDHVQEQIIARTLTISCPNELCGCYLNPSSLEELISVELRHDYTQVVMDDFIAQTRFPRRHPIEYIGQGLGFLWNNKKKFFDCGVIAAGAVGALKLNNWRKENPRTWASKMESVLLILSSGSSVF
uniref:Uncharacterized protein n=1 Tax=Noccaea caerulescens TaxID=107243 RepID=A0A1J3JDI3_NOCCA